MSQERLGEYLGEVMGDHGVSGATISNWERDRHQIHKDDQTTLTALLQVLQQYGGLETYGEAELLLARGNYRVDDGALSLIFPNDRGTSTERSPISQFGDGPYLVIVLGGLSAPIKQMFTLPEREDHEGLVLGCPGLIIYLLSWLSGRWSSMDVLRGSFWILLWLLTYNLTFPFLAWPFASPGVARQAAVLYAVGSLIVPLLIGALAAGQGDHEWRRHPSVSKRVYHLYSQQGASIGFHIGYMTVVGGALFFYYLDIHARFAPYPDFAALFRLLLTLTRYVAPLLPIVIGYAAALQVPYNLWRAFGRLSLRDGAIFFVFILFGPFWAVFFLIVYPTLLSVPTGPVIVGLAIISCALITIQQKRRTVQV